MFDNNDFPKHSPYYFTNSKKVIGKFKCEEGQNCVTEFVGLTSKMYSYKTYSGYEGIKKGVIKKNIKFDDYKDVLFNGIQVVS